MSVLSSALLTSQRKQDHMPVAMMIRHRSSFVCRHVAVLRARKFGILVASFDDAGPDRVITQPGDQNPEELDLQHDWRMDMTGRTDQCRHGQVSATLASQGQTIGKMRARRFSTPSISTTAHSSPQLPWKLYNIHAWFNLTPKRKTEANNMLHTQFDTAQTWCEQ